MLESNGVAEGERDAKLERELLLEPRSEKVRFAETVEVTVAVALREAEELAVDDDDKLDDTFEDIDAVIDALVDTEGDSLASTEAVDVADEECDSEDDADADGESDVEPVVKGVRDLVPPPDLDIVFERVTDGLLDFDLENLAVVEGVDVRENAMENVVFAEDVVVSVSVTEALTLNDAMPTDEDNGDGLKVVENKAVTVGVNDKRIVAEPKLELDELPLTEGDAVFVADLDGDTDEIGENDSLREDDAEADEETMSETLAV